MLRVHVQHVLKEVHKVFVCRQGLPRVIKASFQGFQQTRDALAVTEKLMLLLAYLGVVSPSDTEKPDVDDRPIVQGADS